MEVIFFQIMLISGGHKLFPVHVDKPNLRIACPLINTFTIYIQFHIEYPSYFKSQILLKFQVVTRAVVWKVYYQALSLCSNMDPFAFFILSVQNLYCYVCGFMSPNFSLPSIRFLPFSTSCCTCNTQ